MGVVAAGCMELHAGGACAGIGHRDHAAPQIREGDSELLGIPADIRHGAPTPPPTTSATRSSRRTSAAGRRPPHQRLVSEPTCQNPVDLWLNPVLTVGELIGLLSCWELGTVTMRSGLRPRWLDGPQRDVEAGQSSDESTKGRRRRRWYRQRSWERQAPQEPRLRLVPQDIRGSRTDHRRAADQPATSSRLGWISPASDQLRSRSLQLHQSTRRRTASTTSSGRL